MLNYDSLRKNDSNKCDGKYSHPRTDPIHSPQQANTLAIAGAIKGAATGFAGSALFGGYNKFRKAAADAALSGLNQINANAMNSERGAHMIMTFESQTCVCTKRWYWSDRIAWSPDPAARTIINVYFPDGHDITTDPDGGDITITASDPGGSLPFGSITGEQELDGIAVGIADFLNNNY